MYLKRKISKQILDTVKKMPIITILGPRQSGKTTLAKNIFPNYQYVNMELPLTRDRFLSDPISFFSQIEKGIIIDEFQNVPDLLSYIQVISDEKPTFGKFILTGSQNFTMLEKISQSLAGRTALFFLFPFSLDELKGSKFELNESNEYIFKGFYPRIYNDNLDPYEWYSDYITLYLERDIRNMINIRDAVPFISFLKLCAGRVGQVINFSALSDLVGRDAKTIRSWMSALEASYIIYLLKPYYRNFNKRITKSPKLFFYDTGIVCSLLGIINHNEIDNHYFKGQLFENFVISELIKNNNNHKTGCDFYYWNEQGNNEIDCLIESGGKSKAIEIKASRSYSPNYLKNLIRFRELTGNNFSKGYVVMNGDETFKSNDIEIINWNNLDTITLGK